MENECCKLCRFWMNEDKEISGLAECHRYPPAMTFAARGAKQPFPDAIDTVRPQDGGWPLTFPDDWCGEFQKQANGGEGKSTISPPPPD